MKRSPISRKPNPDRAKLLRAYAKFQKAFMAKHLLCQICHKHRAVECHHLPCGPSRKEAMLEEDACLALCVPCHERCEDYSDMPPSKQCAAKFLDEGWIDLPLINQLRGRDENAIDMADVLKHLSLN